MKTEDITAALAKLVSHESEPLDALATLHKARQTLDQLTQTYVAQARREGATWEDIGNALGGVSRQAIWEKYGTRSEL